MHMHEAFLVTNNYYVGCRMTFAFILIILNQIKIVVVKVDMLLMKVGSSKSSR